MVNCFSLRLDVVRLDMVNIVVVLCRGEFNVLLSEFIDLVMPFSKKVEGEIPLLWILI